MARRMSARIATLASSLWLCACSPGESIGGFDLMVKGPRPTVALSATDTLRFSVDLDFKLSRDLGMGAKAAANASEDLKRRTTLTFELVSSGGVVAAVAKCNLTGPGWSVHNASARRAGQVVSYRGTLTACAIKPPETGSYRLAASVDWAENSDVQPTAARVDVRRVR